MFIPAASLGECAIRRAEPLIDIHSGKRHNHARRQAAAGPPASAVQNPKADAAKQSGLPLRLHAGSRPNN